MKGYLLPLEIPWMVSPSVSDIHLTIVENGNGLVSCEVARLPESDALNAELVNCRVAIVFEACQWARTAPALDQLDVVPHALYDRESSEYMLAEDWLTKFRKLWFESGKCPSPGFYAVENSIWIEETRADRDRCKHFVLEGHDFWIEVLARSFRWEYSGESNPTIIQTGNL